MRPVREFRVCLPCVDGEDHAADRAVERGDEKSDEAEEAYANAEVFGLARILANGCEVQAEGRVHDAPHRHASKTRSARQ